MTLFTRYAEQEREAMRPGGSLRWYWQITALERMGYTEQAQQDGAWMFSNGNRSVIIPFSGKVQVIREG